MALAAYGLCTLFAALVYFDGLDSQHIPKNGDEYPYEHITRVTAGSGRWLPLRSELPELRNTKPPLLFWQGIASTGWGRRWTLWDLRWPSVVYTLLTALLVFALGYRLTARPEAGLQAALCFLAFFSTYRYGRPFLTNPPEVFWLFLPVSAALCWQPRALRSRFAWPALMGVAVGIAVLYKSFALAVPVGLALAWWHLHLRGYRLAAFLAKDAGKVLVTVSVALAVFATWFLLDPDPRAIWSDFVLRENLGKFDLPGGYVARLLWGGSSLWSLALGYLLNAGLLAAPVAALVFAAWRRRHELDGDEALLWIWVITLFLVFSLPSQRSSRYLLAGMPAVAVLLALNWQRIGRRAFAVSLVAAAAVVLAMAALSLRLQQALPATRLYPPTYWLLLAGTEAVVLLAVAIPRFTRPAASAAALLTFLALSGFFRPFDGPLGRYDPEVQRYVQGRDVWVPYDFIAKEEGYRFLLPGARVHGYREERDGDVLAAVGRYPLYVVQVPLTGSAADGDTILGQRLDLRGRQSPREIREILLGNVLPLLFVKDLLVEARATGPRVAAPGAAASLR